MQKKMFKTVCLVIELIKMDEINEIWMDGLVDNGHTDNILIDRNIAYIYI